MLVYKEIHGVGFKLESQGSAIKIFNYKDSVIDTECKKKKKMVLTFIHLSPTTSTFESNLIALMGNGKKKRSLLALWIAYLDVHRISVSNVVPKCADGNHYQAKKHMPSTDSGNNVRYMDDIEVT